MKLTPEHFLYIPPECEHRFRSIGRNECLVLDIPLHVMNLEHHDMASGLEAKVDPFWSSIRYLLKEEANSKSSHTLHLLVQYITEKSKRIPTRLSHIYTVIYRKLCLLKNWRNSNIIIRRTIQAGLKTAQEKHRKNTLPTFGLRKRKECSQRKMNRLLP